MSMITTAGRVGGLIVAMTAAIQDQSGPEVVAAIALAKKVAEAQHTVLQMAYGAATG